MKKKVLILYRTFNLIQSLYLENTEIEFLNKVIKFFAKLILSFIKPEQPAILVTEFFKETRQIRDKRMLSDKIDNLLIKFEKMKI